MGALVDIVTRSQRLRPESRVTYASAARAFEAFAGDESRWTAATVEAWRDHLIAHGNSPRTANSKLYAIRYCSKRYEALGLGRDFARAAEPAPRGQEVKREALTEDELGRLMGQCGNTLTGARDRVLLTLGFRTGARVSGLCNLAWSDIEGKRMTITLKGGQRKVVGLDEDCLVALEAWRSALATTGHEAKGRVLRGLRRELGARGDVTLRDSLTRHGAHRIIAELGERARLSRPVHPHLLRHSFVSHSSAAGISIQRIMAQTGHRSISSLSVYLTDVKSDDDPVGNYLPKFPKKEK